MIHGKRTWTVANPPSMKQQVATSDGHCNVDNPMMEWPEVQPPAYLVPNPTMKPPTTKKIKPFRVNTLSMLKIDRGIKAWSTWILRDCRSCVVFAATTIDAGLLSNCVATIPPMRIPATKKRFHACFFQSYWKNEMFAGMHAAQMCRSEDEIPKCLFPISSNAGTVRPINGPAMYQGQGWRIISNIVKILSDSHVTLWYPNYKASIALVPRDIGESCL